MRKLCIAALAALIALQGCDFYRAEYRDYADVFVRYEASALEVSLVGEWTQSPDGNKVLGSPYRMLVRYVDAEGMKDIELLSLTLRDPGTGVAVPLPVPKAYPFRPIPGDGTFGFGPAGNDPLAVPPNQYGGFRLVDLRLKYQPYEVSGVLVLRAADGEARQVPFSGVLLPKPRRERRNTLIDAVESV